jgi:hypothetical protein
MVNW